MLRITSTNSTLKLAVGTVKKSSEMRSLEWFCATCGCHVREGEVTMTTNYGLEPWEVEKGFVLACQSRPVSEAVTLDYDKT